MGRYSKLVALWFLALLCSVSHAGYQSMRPPPGWQPGGQPSYKPAPGEFYDLDKKTWMTVAQLNVGGKALSVPVALPTMGAVSLGLAVATAFSSNPAILVAGAAWTLYQAYLSQKKITPKPDGTFYQVIDGLSCTSNCFEYQLAYSSTWHKSPMVAAQNWASAASNALNTYTIISIAADQLSFAYNRLAKSNTVPPGPDVNLTGSHELWRRSVPPFNESKTVVIPPSVVATQMQDLPMSKPLVEKLPYAVPVDPPIFNPSSATGEPQVMRLPQGSPIAIPAPSPNPDNVPVRWRTPVIDLIPAPLLSDPWRVEVIPKDIVKADRVPLPDPLNPRDPALPPLPDPKPPPLDPDAVEKAPAEQLGLCDQYPDILACQVFKPDQIAADPFKNTERRLAINKDTGWGPENGTCPAPRTATIHGVTLTMPWTMLCDFATGIRPLLLGFAWFSAALTFFGIGRRE